MTNLMNSVRSPSPTKAPPARREEMRNEVVIIVLVIAALIVGWALKQGTQHRTRSVALGNTLPPLIYPAGWITTTDDKLLLQAVDPRSASTFDARIEAYSRDLREGETLDSVATAWPLSRNHSLIQFRNLSTETVSGPNGAPAILLTYAHVADPTRDSGATGLPVVVKAQDLIFVGDGGSPERLYVITVAADAAEWDAEAPQFQQTFARLGVTGGAQ